MGLDKLQQYASPLDLIDYLPDTMACVATQYRPSAGVWFQDLRNSVDPS